jgi:tetratricopeptide (TPR) repeat protein/TolB-like protein
MIGKTISHYKILEKLGEGGMGVVYRAEDTKLKRTVALKFLSPQALGAEEDKTRFIHEAQAAAALTHPGICTVYEIDEVDGQTFIAMECVEGLSLKEKIASGPMKIDETLSTAIQIAEGLQKAHEKGTIHRDIKSANIMIASDGQAKIMDFGLAKLAGGTKLTKTGTTVGTIAYMSPEQARAGEVDHRSDVWSLGVVLYEMLTGQVPFRGDYNEAVVYSILNEAPEPVTALRTGVPMELERVVVKALEKEAGRRYQSAKELLVDLKNVKDRAPAEGAVRPPSIKASLEPTSRPWRKILIPIAVLLVIAIALVVGVRIQVGRQPAAVAAENSLAVMYFDNLADPEDKGKLGEIATSLLITDLSESQYVRVLSSQRLYDILKLMGREGEKRIDRDVATEVAEKAGAKWMLLGSILQVEPQIEMASHLVDVSSGSVVASQRVAGEPDEKIFALVDKLTVEVKRDLSLPGGAHKEPDPRVADVTTGSAEAYRHYVEGMEYFNKTYDIEAQESFRKAVESDSTFAMAYYRLWLNTPFGDDSRELMAKMARYSKKASRKERAYIEFARAIEERRVSDGIKQLRKIVEAYPDDKEGFYMLGAFVEDDVETRDEAIRSYTRAIEIDSLYGLAYHSLAYVYHDGGDFEKSIWAINKYISSAPGEAEPYGARGDLYAWSGRITEAIESYEKAMQIKPDWYGTHWRLGHMYLFLRQYEEAKKCYRELTASEPYVRSVGRIFLGIIPAYQGKFQEALHVLDVGLAGDKMEKVDKPTELNKRFLKVRIYMERNETALALEEARVCMEREEEIYAASPLYSLGLYAGILTDAGRFQDAEEVAEELKKGIEQHDPTSMPMHWAVTGRIELARGRPNEAVRRLEKASSGYSVPTFEWRVELARAYLAAGRLDAAVRELEGALGRYDEDRVFSPIQAVKAYYLLGQAYERSGWTDRAIEQYEEFLDIWKDADPGIDEIEDAKVRLARLKGAA